MLIAIFMTKADNFFVIWGIFLFFQQIASQNFRLDLHDNEFFFCIVSKVYKRENQFKVIFRVVAFLQCKIYLHIWFFFPQLNPLCSAQSKNTSEV